MAQAPFRHMIIAVRTTRSVADVAVAVGAIVHEMDASLPLTDVGLLTRLVDEELAPDRRNLMLMGGFGVVALLLAGIGVFGVVSWSARQRVTEFGIRLAVGAGPSDILRLVLRQALVLVGVGLGIGVLAAIPAMRLLASQLYGIRASDPVAFIGVAVLLALTGLLAGLGPALRSTRMDPLEALREG
jgi:ABC-type antimicrobial peptide transport system permease subunit